MFSTFVEDPFRGRLGALQSLTTVATYQLTRRVCPDPLLLLLMLFALKNNDLSTWYRTRLRPTVNTGIVR